MSISSLFYTLLSVLEVLLVVVPSLMVVAFITLAERKTMASMQRRIGPNFVGQLKWNLSFIPSFITRHYGNHRVLIINNNSIKGGRSIIRRLFNSSCSAAASTTQPFSCNPDWITGFVDGEGSFGVQIVKSPLYRIGWTVEPSFKISLHHKDRKVLEEIRSYWGVGTITSQGSKGVQFRVRSIKELSVVINHFDKYPLITKKRADFILWC